MENYIYLNGKRIELTPEQVEQLKGVDGAGSAQLGAIPKGEACKIGDLEFIVLGHSEETTSLLLKTLYREEERFGDNNNFANSNVDELCCQFAQELVKIIGAENIVEHTVDLTSDDGLETYGKIGRKASLLTADQYRRFVKILDAHKINKWWWLATPYSTPEHENANWAKCVSPNGSLDYSGCDGGDIGVRPFCILKSNIFVSK